MYRYNLIIFDSYIYIFILIHIYNIYRSIFWWEKWKNLFTGNTNSRSLQWLRGLFTQALKVGIFAKCNVTGSIGPIGVAGMILTGMILQVGSMGLVYLPT